MAIYAAVPLALPISLCLAMGLSSLAELLPVTWQRSACILRISATILWGIVIVSFGVFLFSG